MIFMNTKTSYGNISIVLHWVMAVLITGLFLSGQYMVTLDYYDPWYHSAPWWHKNAGLSVFVLLLCRLIWRLSNTVPESLPTYKAWEKNAAKLVHLLFYIILLLSCVSGYFISTANGAGIDVFGWFELPAAVNLDEAQADLMGDVHEAAAWILVVLFFIHLFAALKHHFIDKDMTLLRMLKMNQKDSSQ